MEPPETIKNTTAAVNGEWPFPGRRYPTTDDPDYLGSKGLSQALRKVIETELAGKTDLDILDIGCGQKPFYPFFQAISKSYIGTDIMADNPMVDRVCPSEALAVDDESMDVVICLSVLEHVDDPVQAVKELHRVVRPTGVVFATTHGCFPWHPHPQDHWRWTQTGLPLLFERYGGFRDVRLFATRGTMSGIFFLLAHYVGLWSGKGRNWRHRVRRPLTRLVNRVGEYVDARTPILWDVNQIVTAIPEFFIIARK
jgi:2-polyprenyl-3-methyl-5-hydroxy-6-metoxy-1,4-benzoquinol methylase